MTTEAIAYIGDCLESLNIPYEFGDWKSDFIFPYFVGEYMETAPLDEDGKEEGTFMITGITDQSYLTLEAVKETIKKEFPDIGRTDILESGSAIFIAYDTGNRIPTAEQGLERIQINLSVKEWRV